jgi:hypothetical protein
MKLEKSRSEVVATGGQCSQRSPQVTIQTIDNCKEIRLALALLRRTRVHDTYSRLQTVAILSRHDTTFLLRPHLHYLPYPLLCAGKDETSVEIMGRKLCCNFLRKSRL